MLTVYISCQRLQAEIVVYTLRDGGCGDVERDPLSVMGRLFGGELCLLIESSTVFNRSLTFRCVNFKNNTRRYHSTSNSKCLKHSIYCLTPLAI